MHMGKPIETFEQALTLAYIENPCGIQANALWKTLNMIEYFNTGYKTKDGKVEKLEIWNEDSTLLYWKRNSDKFNLRKEILEDVDFLLIHNRYLKDIPKEKFTIKEPYFRLIHNSRVEKPLENKNFKIIDVDIKNEAKEVASFISDCYEDIKLTDRQVIEWISHPVFDEKLWIWALDKETNTPAGLGIAEFDKTICEGSLEWIQVLSKYRGKGVGETIVLELLYRLRGKAKYTTVSGEVNNVTNPESLYRRCGFKGEDIWWVLRKQRS